MKRLVKPVLLVLAGALIGAVLYANLVPAVSPQPTYSIAAATQAPSGSSASAKIRDSYRTAKPTATPKPTTKYIGNKNSMVFHKPSCSSVGQMKESNKVSLSSRSAAIDAGYRPCQRCNP